MKKTVSVLAITLLMISMMSVTAFAHGGHGRSHGNRAKVQPQHTLCTTEGCEEAGPHQHDGNWYCSQTGRNGDYALCTVEGCDKLGLHEHDGTNYYCQNHGTGVGCGKGRNR